MLAQMDYEMEASLDWLQEFGAKDFANSAILFMDVDHFRQLSMSLVTGEAEELFRQLIARIRQEVRHDDVVKQVGRDSFVVIQRNFHSKDALFDMCLRLLRTAHEPFKIRSYPILIRFSIGVAAPDASLGLEALLRRAQIALQVQKNAGGAGFRFYTPLLENDLARQNTIIGELAAALEDDEQIVVHYQPLVTREGLSVVGREALIRWQHPSAGLLSPADFLPAAEGAGLIHPLSQYVLQHAARLGRRCPNEYVAVNISPLQCRSVSFAEQAEAIVKRAGCVPEQFELEVTEHFLLDEEQALATILDLRCRGFHIVLDDFGAGYCSLAYLRRFPIDKLKIDRQFIHGLDRDERSFEIVKALIDLGHALNLRVTAEGVETQRQLDLLQDTECDELQGFLLGRPSPAAEDSQAEPLRRTLA